MKIFTIDNNIDGLLSALFMSFTEKIVPDAVENALVFQPRLDAVSIRITTNRQNGERVKKALYTYGGDDIIYHMKICLMSCDTRALTIAFNYGYLTLKERTDISEKLSEKAVSDFSYLIQKVLHERHIVSGFLRFTESENGVLYARYSPDNDITALLAPHFLKRLGHTPFIIHDVKRNVIAISNGITIKTDYTELLPSFNASQQEQYLQNLWKKYFRSVNIKERPHRAQQDSYFPRRYRKYCFETWE